MKCRHCDNQFTKHTDGRLHCNWCGCCFLEDGRTGRPGHPVCRGAEASEVPSAAPLADEESVEAPSVASPDGAPLPIKRAPGRPRKGD
jgi:hypothetical protein